MHPALLEIGLFTAKSCIIFIIVVLLLLIFFGLLALSKQKSKGKLTIKHLNKQFSENAETLLTEMLPKKIFKKYIKSKRAADKKLEKGHPQQIYVLRFDGDMRASSVAALSQEITAILSSPYLPSEVIVKIESPGGVVHGYGLAAAELTRLREAHIPLTVCIDKVAASGGYLMACVANKIIAAPFAIIGSIGVIVQLPNFHRLLKEHQVDYEQLTAGEYKRTLTVFGKNTKAGKEKLQQEIEEIQTLFKNLILTYRPQIDIQQVATGEHWLGQQAIQLKLVDELNTSDSYLLEKSKTAHLYAICYETKKPLLARLTATASALKTTLLDTLSS